MFKSRVFKEEKPQPVFRENESKRKIERKKEGIEKKKGKEFKF